jgi:hypothetical protein
MSGKAQTGKLANKDPLAYSKAGIGKGRHRPPRYAKGHHRPPRGAKARREPQTAKGRRGSASDATGHQRPPGAKQRTPRDTKGRHRPPAATGRAQARKICEQRRLSTAKLGNKQGRHTNDDALAYDKVGPGQEYQNEMVPRSEECVHATKALEQGHPEHHTKTT